MRLKISGAFIIFVCLMAVAADFVTPTSYEVQDTDRVLQGPSSHNWMGTDSLGRDLYSRIVYGARVTMIVGIVTSLMALVIGIFYGAISGYFGGAVDSLMMRSADVLQAIPSLVLMILISVVFNSSNFFENQQVRSVTGILLALGLVGWVSVARLVRGQVLQVKEMPYVEAARALGLSGPRLIFKHILPNIMGPVIVVLTLQIPSHVLYESVLSFIGLGLQPPYSSWGVLANEGWRALRTHPHLIIFPGLALFLTMLAFNFFGESLRDRLDRPTFF